MCTCSPAPTPAGSQSTSSTRRDCLFCVPAMHRARVLLRLFRISVHVVSSACADMPTCLHLRACVRACVRAACVACVRAYGACPRPLYPLPQRQQNLKPTPQTVTHHHGGNKVGSTPARAARAGSELLLRVTVTRPSRRTPDDRPRPASLI